MSQSATPATRNKAQRSKPLKEPHFAALPIGTAIATSRTLATGCERLRAQTQRLANTPSTPKHPQWNRNPCYSFGKSCHQKGTCGAVVSSHHFAAARPWQLPMATAVALDRGSLWTAFALDPEPHAFSAFNAFRVHNLSSQLSELDPFWPCFIFTPLHIFLIKSLHQRHWGRSVGNPILELDVELVDTVDVVEIGHRGRCGRWGCCGCCGGWQTPGGWKGWSAAGSRRCWGRLASEPEKIWKWEYVLETDMFSMFMRVFHCLLDTFRLPGIGFWDGVFTAISEPVFSKMVHPFTGSNYLVVPVVPHKAVAEVSPIGN